MINSLCYYCLTKAQTPQNIRLSSSGAVPRDNRVTTRERQNVTSPDSFPVPTYLLFKGEERLGRNDDIVKIAGYAGKHARQILPRSD